MDSALVTKGGIPDGDSSGVMEAAHLLFTDTAAGLTANLYGPRPSGS